MIEMCLVKRDKAKLSFLSPALADIVYDVCTPIQIHSISKALIERLEPMVDSDFRIPFLMAILHHNLDDQEPTEQFYFSKAYFTFLVESQEWSEDDQNRWKEMFDDEIRAAGHDTLVVLGSDFGYPTILHEKGIGPNLPLLRMYSPPVSYGPMGHSLAVVCR